MVQKYFFTKEIDEKIITIYNNKNRIKGDISELSSFFKIPKYIIYKRANKLGVCKKTKEQIWKPEEIKIINQLINHSVNYIHKQLLLKKYKRSYSAIRNKLNSIRNLLKNETYNANNLAICFGVSSDTVEKWIHKKYIETEKIGNIYIIRNESIKKFIQNFPNKFILSKVNQIWFLDIIFDGKLFKNNK